MTDRRSVSQSFMNVFVQTSLYYIVTQKISHQLFVIDFLFFHWHTPWEISNKLINHYNISSSTDASLVATASWVILMSEKMCALCAGADLIKTELTKITQAATAILHKNYFLLQVILLTYETVYPITTETYGSF